jgi:hypothetical protein
METLAQVVVSEPVLSVCTGAVMTGIYWCLKKLYDIDRRLTTIETRCLLIHAQKAKHE